MRAYIRLLVVAGVLASCFLPQGCRTTRTYEGPRLPMSQTAMIELPVFVRDTRVTILEVDGKPVGIIFGKVEIKTGPHEIKGYCEVTEYPMTRYYRPVTITLSAESGRTYVIRGSRIMDKQTGITLGDFMP